MDNMKVTEWKLMGVYATGQVRNTEVDERESANEAHVDPQL